MQIRFHAVSDNLLRRAPGLPDFNVPHRLRETNTHLAHVVVKKEHISKKILNQSGRPVAISCAAGVPGRRKGPLYSNATMNQLRLRRATRRLLAVTILSALSTPAFAGKDGLFDPEFNKVPFAEWFTGKADIGFKWSERILPVVLSVHQRLLAQIEIRVDGRELARRRGLGKLIFYFEFTDSQGRKYQDHTDFDLEKVGPAVKSAVITISDSAFVIPGEYSVAIAIYNTATGEHTAKRDRLQVLPLNSDPVPAMWRDLPSVDFVDASEPPDCWYLPKERGRLNLAVESRRPVRLEVVANLESSEALTTFRAKDADIRLVLPYLKVLSEIQGPNLKKTISLLDVVRRRVLFEQPEVDQLDWKRLRTAIQGVNPGLIDRNALAGQQNIASFFINEVAQRFARDNGPGPRVVVVLTGAMNFGTSQNLQEIEIKSRPGDHLMYVRMRSVPSLPQSTLLAQSTQVIPGSSGMDELAHGFASVPGLRLLEVQSPGAFREALAAILQEIGSL